jgi:hypothetical protein
MELHAEARMTIRSSVTVAFLLWMSARNSQIPCPHDINSQLTRAARIHLQGDCQVLQGWVRRQRAAF